MSSHLGASGVNGSSKGGVCGSEEAEKEEGKNETNIPGLKAVRPRLGSSYSPGEGRSSCVGQLVRPALPGRNVHRKMSSEGHRGRQREGIQEKDEERQGVEHVERRHRKTEGTEHEHKAQNRHAAGSTDSLSGSNSDIQLNSGLEVGEGSNNLQRRQPCSGSGPSRTSLMTSNEQPQTQRLSSRTATGDLHCHSFSSPREPAPLWARTRTQAAARRSARSQHTQAHITALTSSELGDEEEDEAEEEEQDVDVGEDGGSGVMEVMSQTMTQAVVLPCSPYGERRMSKREKNRIKCLRRRQRRRERWRQSQQESRQVTENN